MKQCLVFFIVRKVERIIERVAWRFSIDGYGFEDLVQIGRIKVWQLMEKYGINGENLDQYLGLIWRSVEFALKSELKKSKAQKRIQLSKAVSLDKEFHDGETGNLYDLLPSKEESAFDALVSRETALELMKNLREKSFRERTPKSKRAVIRLMVHTLGLGRREIPKKVNYKTFLKFGLGRWLWIFFNNSPFRAINFTYPGEFLPYEMARAPQGYWKGVRGREQAIDALRTVLARTGYAPENFPKLLGSDFFEEFKIGVPLARIFGGNRFEYLDAAFPDRYHAWEFAYTPRKYFDATENVIKAVKWLVEEKLDYKMDELTVADVWRERIALRVTKEMFSSHGLRELMASYPSPEPVLRLAYPDKFLPWSFSGKNKWSGEKGKQLAAAATRWLIEEYAKLSPRSSAVNYDFFRFNGLLGMITAKSAGFESSPRKVLENAYPNLFQSTPR